MRRVWSLVALPAIALSVSAGTVRAAHINTLAVGARVDAASAVTALSLVPGEGTAEIVISVTGPVSVEDFVVPTPHRIVVDVIGARLARMAHAYDRLARGGITNIRMSQYRPDVVRIVLDVEGPRDYVVSRDDNDIRITLTGDVDFAAWYSSGLTFATTETRPDASYVERETPVTSVVATGSVGAPLQTRTLALFTNQSQQPRITVTYQDADIRDVLAAFAGFSGRTIVVGKDVAGTVTAEIKDQPWDVALKAILEAHGLAATEESSGIITVDSYKNIIEKQASEPVTTQLISINYVSATSLVPTIQGLLYKECAAGASASGTGAPATSSGCVIRGTVAADSATNMLIVTEVASRLPDLMQYVKGLDVRTPQVALKAKIISVSRTQIEQLGLSYDLGSAGTFFNTLLPRVTETGTAQNVESQVTLGGDAVAGVGNASRKYRGSSALSLIFSTALGKFSLTSFLDALRETSLSDIQAEPSIVTLDNREARILVGQETPVRVIDAGGGQIGAPVRANVQFRETGIILTVTPHITNNRQIRMVMEAEQSELRIVGGDLGFIIDKRNARTQVLVNNGETAVIGGLTQTQVTKNKSGIPFLSDLPLIGRLFSQSDTREEKKDLLILITPHIIDEGAAVRPPNGSK